MSDRPRPGAATETPPSWMRRLMGWALPRDRRREMVGEMDLLYARQASRSSRAGAGVWYLRHVLGFGLVRIGGLLLRTWEGAAGALSTVMRDARLGSRVLRRRPGYALSSVATLGVGIGGVVAVFSVANWVMLRPVPGVVDGARLATVRLGFGPGSPAFPVSGLDLVDLERMIPMARQIEAATHRDANVVWNAGSDPDRRTASVVTAGFFDLLGMQAAMGRLPIAGGANEAREVVISHDMWRRHFDRAPAAIGAEIFLNGEAFGVIGVAPEGFRGAELPGNIDLWVTPASAPLLEPGLPDDFEGLRGQGFWTDMIADLGGADPAGFSAEGQVAIQRIRDEIGYPHSFLAMFRLDAYPGLGLSPHIRPVVTRTLKLLSVAAVVLLLLAIANAANLALTHSSAQGSSIAVHTALGASRGRLVSKGVVEHILIGVVGTLAGVGLALVGVALFREGSVSTFGASLDGLELDMRVFAFALGIAVAASVMAGLGPTLALSRVNLSESLQGHRTRSRKMFVVQNGLVILQVALSTVLLVSSGLLARTALNLRHTEVGFEPDHAVRFSLDPGVEGYEPSEVTELVDRLVARLESQPGLGAAGFVYPAPVQPRYLTSAYYPSGGDPEADRVLGGMLQATENLLPAMGARLIAGRLPLPSDRTPGSLATPVVVTRSFAERAFPETEVQAALGRTLLQSSGEGRINVVGVVENLRFISLSDEVPPLVFLPWGTIAVDAITGWVRTSERPSGALQKVRSLTREAAPTLPLFGLATGRAQVDALVVEDRILARLGLSLAGLGLLLAGIGLQGVLSYLVLQRRKEIGIRLALGAPAGAIHRSITGRALLLTLSGLVLGSAATVPATGLIAARLHGLTPLDPLTWSVVLVALLGTGFAASSIPAWRSTRVDARDALMSE